MSQHAGNGAQNAGWYRNLAAGAPSTLEPQSALGSKKRPPELILPKGYTDQDFGDLLSSAVASPELLTTGAMVNYRPAALDTASNTLRFNAESQVAIGSKDPTTGTGRWGNNNELMPPVETVVLSTELDIDDDNASETGSTPPESVVEEPMEDTTTPATSEYEVIEDKGLLKLMALATPLELVIGAKQNEICIACFHVGHHHTDFDTCPTARIGSLFSENGPYYSRLPEKTKARVLLMKDIGWACQGLSWAVQHVCQGYMREFKIFPGTVSQLHKLLHRWKSVVHDEKFTFGGFVECGGELTFDQAVQIAPIQSARGSSEKIQLKKNFSELDTLGGENSETGNNFLNSFIIPKTMKQKTECDADRLQLPVLGNRPAAICTNCLHRGHAKSSIKICPYLIVSVAIEKLKSGKKRQDNVSNEIECLEKVVGRMTGPGEHKKVEPIISLIAEWNEATINLSSNGKKTRVISSKPLRGQYAGTPIDFQAYGPPTVFPNGPSHQTLDLENSNHSSLAPFYNQEYVPNVSTPFPGFSKPSPPPLNSPFDENETSEFYDPPFGNDEGFASPPPPQESQHQGDFQHEYTEFSPVGDPFLGLEELGTSEFPDEERMQTLFGNDFNLSMLDSFSSLPINTSRPSGQRNNDNHFSGTPKVDSRNRLGDIISPSEQDWSQPSQSQSTYVSALSSQQNNNPPNHENNQTNYEYNPVDELPPEIFWRTRCPLKLIGNRGDSFCKICLHYGHDKRSQSCLVNVVRIAIAGNKLQGVLAVSETIKDLEAGVKWQRNLPEEMQGDDNMILNLIRRWKETAESLRKAEDSAEVAVDLRDAKRRRSMDVLRVPVRRQQVPRMATTTQQEMQMDREIEHFTPNVSRSLESQYSQAYQPQSPRRIAPGNHQMQSWMHPPTPQQQSFPPPPSQQTFAQQPFQNRPFIQQQEIAVTPRGWAIDYSRMDSNLFTQISDYIISDGDPADSDNLRVDNQKMPPMLIVAIRKFVIPESLVKKAFVSQPVAHQQQDPQPQGLSSMHLQDIGQHYNNQMQAPKRKRN